MKRILSMILTTAFLFGVYMPLSVSAETVAAPDETSTYETEINEFTELEMEDEQEVEKEAEIQEAGIQEAAGQQEAKALLSAEDNIAGGVIDEEYGHITWVIDSAGKLTVTGTGNAHSGTVFGYYNNPWYSYRDQILSAEINVTGMTDASYLLSWCTNLKSVDFSKFDTSSVTDMSHMMQYCMDLENLNLSGWDTSSVMNMSSMFYYCPNLKNLNLSGWDTSNVTNMSHLFGFCTSLKGLNISGWDTGYVTDMSYMFTNCESLENLDLRSFDTSHVRNMTYMFNNCEKLKSLDLNGWDTSRVTDMSCMFSNCSYLKSLDLSGFDTGEVIYITSMFSGCEDLESLNISGWDTSKLIGIHSAFKNCRSLKSLDLSSFDLTKITSSSYLNVLEGCTSLKQIKTPINCNVSVELPVKRGEFWEKEDETVITELPQSLSESITINKRAFVQDIFIDVTDGAWYTDAVQDVYDKGIMEGNGDKFTPNGKMTRGMFVTTLYRLAGEPEITERSACEDLNDVAKDAWYTDAVCWAYSTGVTTGYESDKTFRTNAALTREQLATFIYRYAQYQGMDVSVSDDLSGLVNADKVKPYAETEVKWAVGSGLISGLESKDASEALVYDLAPQGTATRAQMAAILQRFMEM